MRNYFGQAYAYIAHRSPPRESNCVVSSKTLVDDRVDSDQTIPSRTALAAASARVVTPSLARMAPTCFEAVRLLMKSASPIA